MEVPDYTLPETSIAQSPIEPRDAARLLDGRVPAAPVHRHVRDLPDLLQPGDVIVVNNTRVIPARLLLEKLTGGQAEVLLLEPLPDEEHPGPEANQNPRPDRSPPAEWKALVRPGRRLPPGTDLQLPGLPGPVMTVGKRLDDGQRIVRFWAEPQSVIERAGALALPPYIHRPLTDPSRYQTVYAENPGSVAAPTAGLHLTHEVMAKLEDRHIEVVTVDLAVGLGTFRPIGAEKVEDHVMHVERYRVPEETWSACKRAGRVIAVGTTSVRALETVAATGRLEGESDLFITPGFPFRVVDLLVTNFHLPRSTLLLLLWAFCGPPWRDLYSVALEEGYRFLSFGDAMLVARP